MRDWRKSSFSGQNSNCVEVAHGTDRVGVRDAKNQAGPVLTLSADTWTRFLRVL